MTSMLPDLLTARTILTVEPLDYNAFGNTMMTNFGGAVTRFKKVVQVPYPASLAADSIDKGVAALDALLATTDGTVLVFAHSQGCQVVSRWLRGHPGGPGADRISFLLIGNLLRKYGGGGVGGKEVDGKIGVATPTDTAFRVVDVKLQYDGWADMPTKSGVAANLNAVKGRFSRHALGYRAADLFNPAATRYVENTTEYVMLPGTPLIPCPQALIEKSYSRPER